MADLPNKLYTVDSVMRLEQLAIDQFDIPAYELMQRAGLAVFSVIRQNYPSLNKILVVCGSGNNAGDGYVVARLARDAGYQVKIVSLGDSKSLKSAAKLAYQDWLKVSAECVVDNDNVSVIDKVEIIVDAILGTGLTREVSAQWSLWIEAINRSAKPVISVDIPSGLMANTGVIAGVAIEADITVCFIGLKQGMFTAQGKDVCGEIIFDDLDVSAECYAAVPHDALLIDSIDYRLLPKRKPSSHKGNFGHVLIVGGNIGMPGAVILAARATLRAGAGLVTIITVAENLEAIAAAVPEAMIRSCDATSADALFTEAFVNGVTHVAVGMGLGQSSWSETMLKCCVQLGKPMLIDADGLNILAKGKFSITSPLIITPHPGEAGRLLTGVLADNAEQIESINIQQDRFMAIKKLHALIGRAQFCTVVLKGSGTLIFDGQTMKVCNSGTPAMAAPGMGDVLSGILIALMAQSYQNTAVTLTEIAELGVCLHARAAELIVGDRTRGLLASDVIDKLPEIMT